MVFSKEMVPSSFAAPKISKHDTCLYGGFLKWGTLSYHPPYLLVILLTRGNASFCFFGTAVLENTFQYIDGTRGNSPFSSMINMWWFAYEKWWFPIATFDYQRVSPFIYWLNMVGSSCPISFWGTKFHLSHKGLSENRSNPFYLGWILRFQTHPNWT